MSFSNTLVSFSFVVIQDKCKNIGNRFDLFEILYIFYFYNKQEKGKSQVVVSLKHVVYYLTPM